MKFRFSPLLLLLFALGSAAPCLAAANPGEAAHAPQSASEKMLDEIIRLAESDKSLSDFVLKRPGFDAAKGADYAKYFTRNLLNAWADAEATVVQQNCQGHYAEGQICGLDINPVTCRPDADKGGEPLYQTKEDHRDKALVSYQWMGAEGQTDETFYRLVKEGDAWKLDGVDCGDGMIFNME